MISHQRNPFFTFFLYRPEMRRLKNILRGLSDIE